MRPLQYVVTHVMEPALRGDVTPAVLWRLLASSAEPLPPWRCCRDRSHNPQQQDTAHDTHACFMRCVRLLRSSLLRRPLELHVAAARQHGHHQGMSRSLPQNGAAARTQTGKHLPCRVIFSYPEGMHCTASSACCITGTRRGGRTDEQPPRMRRGAPGHSRIARLARADGPQLAARGRRMQHRQRPQELARRHAAAGLRTARQSYAAFWAS